MVAEVERPHPERQPDVWHQVDSFDTIAGMVVADALGELQCPYVAEQRCQRLDDATPAGLPDRDVVPVEGRAHDSRQDDDHVLHRPGHTDNSSGNTDANASSVASTSRTATPSTFFIGWSPSSQE